MFLAALRNENSKLSQSRTNQCRRTSTLNVIQESTEQLNALNTSHKYRNLVEILLGWRISRWVKNFSVGSFLLESCSNALWNGNKPFTQASELFMEPLVKNVWFTTLEGGKFNKLIHWRLKGLLTPDMFLAGYIYPFEVSFIRYSWHSRCSLDMTQGFWRQSTCSAELSSDSRCICTRTLNGAENLVRSVIFFFLDWLVFFFFFFFFLLLSLLVRIWQYPGRWQTVHKSWSVLCLGKDCTCTQSPEVMQKWQKTPDSWRKEATKAFSAFAKKNGETVLGTEKSLMLWCLLKEVFFTLWVKSQVCVEPKLICGFRPVPQGWVQRVPPCLCLVGGGKMDSPVEKYGIFICFMHTSNSSLLPSMRVGVCVFLPLTTHVGTFPMALICQGVQKQRQPILHNRDYSFQTASLHQIQHQDNVRWPLEGFRVPQNVFKNWFDICTNSNELAQTWHRLLILPWRTWIDSLPSQYQEKSDLVMSQWASRFE